MKVRTFSSLTDLHNRFRFLLIVLLLASCGIALSSAHATEKELSTAKSINAIKIEVENRIRNEIPVSVPWRTLTPPLLSELLRQPAMTMATDQAVKLLLDQAGAWDLLYFEKPSDILASWQRWFPSEPGFHPNPTGWAIPQLNYYATGDYSDEAGAWMILSHCLPPPAWLAQKIEPMILTLEQGDNWDCEYRAFN